MEACTLKKQTIIVPTLSKLIYLKQPFLENKKLNNKSVGKT